MDKILLTDINEVRWLFHRDEKNRLCYSCDGAPKQILQPEVGGDFDIITDGNGFFHLAVQDAEGSLIYLTYNFNIWKKYVILKSKSGSSVMSRFKLFSLKGVIHCFYILTLKDKSMLVHHIFSTPGSTGTPEVISYIDTTKNISLCADSNEKIHIFFFDASGIFNYKIRQNGKTEDCSFPTEDDIKSISVVSCGTVHALYTAKIKNYYTLIYYNFSTRDRKIISFSDSNISEIYIYIKSKTLSVQWRERTRCYQCVSSDGGASFKKPVHITEGRGKRIETVKVRKCRNPLGFDADKCIALTDGERITLLNSNDTKHHIRQNNHTSRENSYNVIDGEYSDQIRSMQAKIRENEKELVRLNTVISTISEKISAIAKSNAMAKAKPTLENSIPDILSEKNVGQLDKENYERFKNTDVESIEFDGVKTFE